MRPALGRTLLASLAFTVACATPPMPTSQRPTPPVAPGPSPVIHAGALEDALAESCASCHDGEPGRPNFEDKHVLSKVDAMRVGLLVGGAFMPPPPSELGQGARTRMIRLACERASALSRADACVTQLSSVEPSVWLAGTDALRRLMDEAVKSTVGDTPSPPALSGLFRWVDPETLSLRLGSTVLVMMTSYAAQRCGDPAQVGEGHYRECLRRALDYKRAALDLARASAAPLSQRTTQ